MCRLVHRLGFAGRYVICDLPELSILRRYYLKSVANEGTPEPVGRASFGSARRPIYSPVMSKARLIRAVGRVPGVSAVLRWYANRYAEGSVVTIPAGYALAVFALPALLYARAGGGQSSRGLLHRAPPIR